MAELDITLKLISMFVDHELVWYVEKGFPNRGETLVVPNTIYTDLKVAGGRIVYGHPTAFKHHDDEKTYGSDDLYYGEALRRLEYSSINGNIILEFHTGTDMFLDALKYVLNSKIDYIKTHIPETLIDLLTKHEEPLDEESLRFLQQAILYCQKHTKELDRFNGVVNGSVHDLRSGLDVVTNLNRITTDYINDIVHASEDISIFTKGPLKVKLWKIAKNVNVYQKDR